MQSKRSRVVKAVIVLSAILVGVALTDYVVGYRQDAILREKAELKKKLEKLAWYTLRSDISDVAYEGDKYRISVKYEKNRPEEADVYLMTPVIRCFVQVKTYWKEVPVHEVPGNPEESAVVKLAGPITIDKIVEVPFRDFEELLPGYMHVRVNSVSYVVSSAISKEDVAEKGEDFYIYLKPYYADDRKMAKNYTFANNIIPIWIPMPPH